MMVRMFPPYRVQGCRNELVRACFHAKVFGCDTPIIAEHQEGRRAHKKVFRFMKPKTWDLGQFHERAKKPTGESHPHPRLQRTHPSPALLISSFDSASRASRHLTRDPNQNPDTVSDICLISG